MDSLKERKWTVLGFCLIIVGLCLGVLGVCSSISKIIDNNRIEACYQECLSQYSEKADIQAYSYLELESEEVDNYVYEMTFYVYEAPEFRKDIWVCEYDKDFIDCDLLYSIIIED